MKKLLILAIVMLVASMANAGLKLSVDGVVDPPETSITIKPSDRIIIDIVGDGMTDPSLFYMGLAVNGPGSLQIDEAALLYPGSDKGLAWDADEEIAGMLGINFPFVDVSLNDIPAPGTGKAPLTGKLIDNIIFHCEGVGDVVILLFSGDGEILDTQVIHQIPEPVTVALLGLGALLIRRK